MTYKKRRLSALSMIFITALTGVSAACSEDRKYHNAYDEFVCNYANVYNNNGTYASIYKEPKVLENSIKNLENGYVIYICDEKGDWYQVYFDGNCTSRHDGGIQYLEAKDCAVGWLQRSNAKVLSG